LNWTISPWTYFEWDQSSIIAVHGGEDLPQSLPLLWGQEDLETPDSMLVKCQVMAGIEEPSLEDVVTDPWEAVSKHMRQAETLCGLGSRHTHTHTHPTVMTPYYYLC